MSVLFISESYLKNNTVVDDNVDQRLIIPSIVAVQDMRLHPILGTPLFDDLKTKVTNSTLNANEITLINDFISKMLLQWTMYELTTSMLFKYRNKSVATQGGDARQIDYKDLQYLKDDWKNKAQFYDERLINHLIDNKSLFPNYTAVSDDISAKKSAYNTSFYLGGGRSDCWKDDWRDER